MSSMKHFFENNLHAHRVLNWIIPILVSWSAFYITLACIVVDFIAIMFHGARLVGEISLIGDIVFFSLILVTRRYKK